MDSRVDAGRLMTSFGPFELGARADEVLQGGSYDLVVRPSGIRFVEDPTGDWFVRDVRYRSAGRVLFVSAGHAPALSLVRVDADQGTLPVQGVKGRMELRSRNAFLFAKTSR